MSGFDFWAACKQAIAIDSTSSHGNFEYVEFLKVILDKMDLQVRTEPVESGIYRGLNVVAEKGGGPDVILFDTHLDTVSAGDPSYWTETGGDPFRAVIRDGKIYGLGTADVKLDFLCKLKALEQFAGKRFRNRFILLGTFGEEVGLLGARAFLDRYTGQLDFALIGEPTSLKLVNRHKGRGCYEFRVSGPSQKEFAQTLKLEFRGKAAHSSTPDKGKNAIELALDFLSQINPPPGHIHIEAGRLLNIVPDLCVVIVPHDADLEAAAGRHEARSGPGGKELLSEASELWKFWDSMRVEREKISKDTSWVCVTAKSAAGGGAFIFEFDSRYWEEAESISDKMLGRIPAACRVIRKDASFFETSVVWHVEGVVGALREIGLDTTFAGKMGSTEAALFGQRCTSLVFGPGQSEGNIHSPNECNLISELESAITAYQSILRRLVAVP